MIHDTEEDLLVPLQGQVDTRSPGSTELQRVQLQRTSAQSAEMWALVCG